MFQVFCFIVPLKINLNKANSCISSNSAAACKTRIWSRRTWFWRCSWSWKRIYWSRY